MARILLIKFEEATAQRLAAVFEVRRHRVRTYDGPFAPYESLEAEGQDLIVLDVSADDADVTKCLTELQRYRAAHGPRPMILCASRVYRGPRFELDLEKRGARLVYFT